MRDPGLGGQIAHSAQRGPESTELQEREVPSTAEQACRVATSPGTPRPGPSRWVLTPLPGTFPCLAGGGRASLPSPGPGAPGAGL